MTTVAALARKVLIIYKNRLNPTLGFRAHDEKHFQTLFDIFTFNITIHVQTLQIYRMHYTRYANDVS